MKTDYNERLSGHSDKPASKTPMIIGAVAVAVVIALGAWFYLGEDSKKPAPAVIKELPAPSRRRPSRKSPPEQRRPRLRSCPTWPTATNLPGNCSNH